MHMQRSLCVKEISLQYVRWHLEGLLHITERAFCSPCDFSALSVVPLLCFDDFFIAFKVGLTAFDIHRFQHIKETRSDK